jgi:hypothetical protein
MPRAYGRPLYILPFDHRDSFVRRMFGWTAPLSEAEIATAKRRAAKVAPNAAVDEIARCYREFVTVFESASSPAATRTDA